MRCSRFVPLAVVLLAGVPGRAEDAAVAATWRRFAAQSQAVIANLNRAPSALPPAPEGILDVAFSEFFGPIGDRGPEYSEKLRALAGRRVRLVGFMAREQVHAPGVFLLTPWPVVVESTGLCYYEDLPPNTVHVVAPGSLEQPLPYRPGRLALIGTLEIGPRLEADGRNSTVRLILDADGLAAFLGAPATRPTGGTAAASSSVTAAH
jgi:hypothetical protein